MTLGGQKNPPINTIPCLVFSRHVNMKAKGRELNGRYVEHGYSES